MSFDLVLSDLGRMNQTPSGYEDRTRLEAADVLRWSAALGCTRAALYDQLALYLAHGYNNDNLTFYYCDGVVNDLWSIIGQLDGSVGPELWWKVFEAFDQGEYYHDDRRDTDPEELYTRPMIAAIVADHPLRPFNTTPI